MRLLLLLLLLGGLAVLPFVMLKRPWAMRIWQRFRIVLVVYVIIIVVAAIVRLVFNWDAIYG